MKKHVVINNIAIEIAAKTYLEIGYGDGSNFNLINVDLKESVDPFGVTDNEEDGLFSMSSDEYFEINESKFDLIFIDGDHTSEQVEKDIINSWNCLTANGVIILHDVKPFTKEMQLVPRTQDQWTGDVWRAYEGFKKKYPKIKTKDVQEKYGLGIIYKNRSKIKEGFIDIETTYEEFIS